MKSMKKKAENLGYGNTKKGELNLQREFKEREKQEGGGRQRKAPPHFFPPPPEFLVAVEFRLLCLRTSHPAMDRCSTSFVELSKYNSKTNVSLRHHF